MIWKACATAVAAVGCLAHGLACDEGGGTSAGGSSTTSTAGTGGTSTAGAGGTSSGGASMGGTGGGLGELAETYCNAMYTRAEQCGLEATPPEDCLAASRTICMFELTRPEVLLDLVTCLVARPCDENDDRCFYQVGADHPTAGQSEYFDACNAKHTACSGVFSDDWCYTTLLTTAMYAELTPCFDLPCDQVSACYEGASWPPSCQ